MDHVEIYTDGACSGNPGPGGWGAIMRTKGIEKELSGGEKDTTNNRMEMMAVIAALEALQRDCSVKITTDSQYVMKGMLEWLPGWKKRNWQTAAKKPVKNIDLWQRLERAAESHQLEWEWVRGHQGHVENERADQLAVAARDIAVNQ
tara:strand:+ start:2067 stop:2507 length:441 start_codon:yes stop_codon:yes gene_type:complete